MRSHFFSLALILVGASSLSFPFVSPSAVAASRPLKVGDKAPGFTTTQDDGSEFLLASRKDKGWTVLYFYPKAETPGCTAQACAFRDSVKLIRAKNAEVYGVSTDSPAKLAAFRKKHNLNFPLLSDENAKVVSLYGVKMPVVDIAKRWTFLIDPQLNVRWIDNAVDPAKDAANVATKLAELQASKVE
jgi:peroxiredoxin Q/BCP